MNFDDFARMAMANRNEREYNLENMRNTAAENVARINAEKIIDAAKITNPEFLQRAQAGYYGSHSNLYDAYAGLKGTEGDILKKFGFSAAEEDLKERKTKGALGALNLTEAPDIIARNKRLMDWNEGMRDYVASANIGKVLGELNEYEKRFGIDLSGPKSNLMKFFGGQSGQMSDIATPPNYEGGINTEPVTQKVSGWRNTLGDVMPAIGGVVGTWGGGLAGSAVGGVGAVPGAVIGGGLGTMAGGTVGRMIKGEPVDIPQTLFEGAAGAVGGRFGAGAASKVKRFMPNFKYNLYPRQFTYK